MERIQGTWEKVSQVFAGRESDVQPGTRYRFTDVDRFLVGDDYRPIPGLSTPRIAYELDPTPMPGHMDWGVDGDNDGVMDNVLVRAIYELDGDTLIICSSESGERPQVLEAPIGSQANVWTFRRVTEEEEE